MNINVHNVRMFLTGQRSNDVWQLLDDDVTALLACVRTMSGSLRPAALDYLGLEGAVRQLLQHQFGETAIRSSFACAGVARGLGAALEITAYRIVQESIANIAHHASATRVEVRIDGSAGGRLDITVRDNGGGFKQAAEGKARPDHLSSGLSGMRERVELLGGKFSIESSAGQGTCIVATLPLARPCPGA
ncbi:MAG: ATP-binding protein [Pseudomonadota bacterium]